jgi:hypothetical protein
MAIRTGAGMRTAPLPPDEDKGTAPYDMTQSFG